MYPAMEKARAAAGSGGGCDATESAPSILLGRWHVEISPDGFVRGAEKMAAEARQMCFLNLERMEHTQGAERQTDWAGSVRQRRQGCSENRSKGGQGEGKGRSRAEDAGRILGAGVAVL